MSPLSDGEVHFLWWFIDGSITVPETRWRLRQCWGFCDRHAWGVLLGEAAYRHGYLHGPAILYTDLMERAQRAFQLRGPWGAPRVAWRLRETGPCLMCELGLQRRSADGVAAGRLQTGRDPGWLRAMAMQTAAYWSPTVCGCCETTGSSARCRIHFREDALAGRIADLAPYRAVVDTVMAYLARYTQSFVFGYHHTETDHDRAALISAVGWCSGWRGFLTLVMNGLTDTVNAR